jgi:RNA polymerase sigma-70 factor, ECF subfamily
MPNDVADQEPGSSVDPRRMLARIQQGENDLLGQLMDSYRNYLNLLAEMQLDRKLRARVSPSDIVQETMLAAYRDFGQFRGRTEAEFLGWLRQILVNNLARAIQVHVLAGKRDVRQDVRLEQLNASMERSTVKLRDALAAPGESPSANYARREQAVLLADVMSELSVDHRQVLVLRNLQGLRFAEVAERMDRSIPACKMLWIRAIKKMRELYAAKEGGSRSSK